MQALTNFSTLRHGAVPFDQIKAEDFVPALDATLKQARIDLEAWKKKDGTSFTEVLVALDGLREPVDQVSSIFYNLHSADCTDAIDKVAPDFSSKLTVFGNDIRLDARVFERIKKCWETKDTQKLTSEERMILDKTYRGFVRNGANLDEKGKARLREIDEALTQVGLAYSQNVLKATNSFQLFITDPADLAGLPDSFKEASAEAAEKKGKPGQWLVGLDYPSFVPFMTYSKNRKLRHELFVAQASKAYQGEYDNSENVLKIVQLRHERAHLLGFKTHADFVLEERMAESPSKVRHFLMEILEKAKPAAKRELEKLRALAQEMDGITELQRWDTAYYTEILKQREIGLDEESLRPYFKLENVVNGVFEVAKRLYGLEFKAATDLPVYHEDVKVFEVFDKKKNGQFVGLFYTDFFPRPTKRGGAWMNSFFDQGLRGGKVQRPHISIVCNFTKPTKTKPSLLSLDEVTTLYHEFGHALHGLLSQVQYTTLAGTNVYWDFVELPSQMMENWVFQKECLDIFAAHHEGGDKIPLETIEKIKTASNFMEATATLRQISFGLLDMDWHTTDPKAVRDVASFENQAIAPANLLPMPKDTNASCSFSHIFAGGYSSGYYSYKWAEVLDADAFEFFLEKGIFSDEASTRFRENILEKGGTEHPMELYKRFRGKEPSVDALLKRAGLSG